MADAKAVGATVPTSGGAGAGAEATGADADVRRAYEEAPVPMATLAGPDHRYVAVNRAYRATYGDRDDLLGRTPEEIWPELRRQQVSRFFDAVLADAQPTAVREWHLAIDLDGSGAPGDRWYDLTAHPYGAVAGGPAAGVHVTITDVTEQVARRLRAERHTDEAERRIADLTDVVTALQAELLPGGVPVLDGLDVVAAYRLADEELGAGGDWFDCVVRPGGTVALVVGDVVGHGVGASAVMGQLRAVLRGHLVDGTPLVDAWAALDRFARSVPGAHAATVCVVEVDREAGALSYVTAGHPPPLLLPPDGGGPARPLPPTGGRPLATGGRHAAGPAGAGTARLRMGEAVMLYTDGAVERPGRTLTDGISELGHLATEALARAVREAGPVAVVADVDDVAVDHLTRDAVADDVTLLLARRTPAAEPLRYEGPAVAQAQREVRRALVRWLDRLEADQAGTHAVAHVLAELVANVVDHAYDGADDAEAGARPVVVEVRLDADGTLVGEVRDAGRWRTPGADPQRGRGLAMARALVGELEVHHDDQGTRATFAVPLVRSSHLRLPSVDAPARPAPERDTLDVVARDDAVVVSGPVDHLSSDALRAQLLRASRGGSRPLVVDLDGVTLLSSAGVRVLHELTAAARPEARVELRASPGTLAGQLLELVGLDPPGA